MKHLKNYIFSLITLTIIFSANVLANKRVKRILGGTDATPGKYSYQVSLQLYGSHICGGSIMNNLFIITAAHCLVDGNGELLKQQITVVMGTVDLKKPHEHTIKIKASKYYMPVEYNPKDDSPIADIALIKLERSIGMKKNYKYVSSLKIPEEPYTLYVGLATVITGFGLNKITVHTDPKTNKSYETGESFGKMRYLPEKVMVNEDCDKVLKQSVLPQHLCARAIRKSLNPEGVCALSDHFLGDSGGPLVINNNEIIGVLSQGPVGCKEIRGAGRYTRVTSFIPFIKNALNEVKNVCIREAEWIVPKQGGRPVLIEKRRVNCRRSI